MSFSYEFTEHALQRINERGISIQWIEKTLYHPTRVEPHESDPELSYALAVISEYGNRVLRVVYKTSENPVKIITVYFDRTMKGKL